MSSPSAYYSDPWVTLYLGDCLRLDDWLTADVLVTDPPYGSQGIAGSYGRRQKSTGRTIQNDLTTEVRDEALWDKREPGINGGPWRYTHESIFVRGEGWVRRGASSFSIISVPSGNGSPEKADHVHAKPLGLMTRLIDAAPAGTIADPFSGSGSTLLAAKVMGRQAVGVELEERYCEVIAKRLSQDTLFGGVA
jgi:DNA modification methylase